jgi:predicted PurR-regulated permease PerM
MTRFHTMILLLIAVAVLYFAKEVFVPLALAGVISMLLSGPVTRLERWHVPRSVAVTVCVLITFGLIGLIGYVVGSQIVGLAEQIPSYRQNITEKWQALQGGGGALQKVKESGKVLEQVATPSLPPPVQPPTTHPASQPATQPNIAVVVPSSPSTPESPGKVIGHQVLPDAGTPTIDPEKGVAIKPPAHAAHDGTVTHAPDGSQTRPFYAITHDEAQSPLMQLWTWLGFVLSPLGTAGIVIVFVIFILLEREDLRDRMIRLVSQGKYTVTTTALDDGVTRVLKFLRAQAIVNGTYGLAVALGLWIIGFTIGRNANDAHDAVFPSFLLWGLLACLLRFIPYIGPWVAAAFPITLSLIVYHGFGVFIGVLALFLVIELLSNNIMEPILYGTTTGLSTMAILVSAVFWTWLWGPIGLLLSTPLTVCAMVLGRYAPPLRFLEVLLGDRPAMTPPERVYQRLLAGDPDEAIDVALNCYKEDGLLRTFDEVALPALAMSETDTAEGLLGEDREVDVIAGMWRLIEELGKQALDDQAEKTKADVAADGDASAASMTSAKPNGSSVRIAILPAHDEADELAGLMLTHVLRLEGDEVLNVSHNALASEMLDSVVQFDPHLVMISATPPAATSHVRYLLRRLTERISAERIAVGVWSARTDAETLRRRLDVKEQQLCTHLTDARDTIHKLTEVERHTAATAS